MTQANYLLLKSAGTCPDNQATLLEYNTSKGVYQIYYFDSSCLNGQAILLEYNTSKGVYQINYFNFNFNFILTLIITLTLTLTLYLASFTVALLVHPFGALLFCIYAKHCNIVISSISAKVECSRTYLIKLLSVKIHVSIRICLSINQYLQFKFFLHSKNQSEI